MKKLISGLFIFLVIIIVINGCGSEDPLQASNDKSSDDQRAKISISADKVITHRLIVEEAKAQITFVWVYASIKNLTDNKDIQIDNSDSGIYLKDELKGQSSIVYNKDLPARDSLMSLFDPNFIPPDNKEFYIDGMITMIKGALDIELLASTNETAKLFTKITEVSYVVIKPHSSVRIGLVATSIEEFKGQPTVVFHDAECPIQVKPIIFTASADDFSLEDSKENNKPAEKPVADVKISDNECVPPNGAIDIDPTNLDQIKIVFTAHMENIEVDRFEPFEEDTRVTVSFDRDRTVILSLMGGYRLPNGTEVIVSLVGGYTYSFTTQPIIPVDPNDIEFRDYFPLKTGNSWEYEVFADGRFTYNRKLSLGKPEIINLPPNVIQAYPPDADINQPFFPCTVNLGPHTFKEWYLPGNRILYYGTVSSQAWGPNVRFNSLVFLESEMIVGQEKITVQAGTFTCIMIKRDNSCNYDALLMDPTRYTPTDSMPVSEWYAKGIGMVKREYTIHRSLYKEVLIGYLK